MTLPQDIVNRALDALGAGTVIGSFGDGTAISEAARRVYGPLLRQMLGAAHWNFARKMAPLQLLADATGNTLAPGGEPYSSAVEPPWCYCYAWPSDGVRARWMPWALNAAPSNPPQITGAAPSAVPGGPLIPARFLVSSSDQFPSVTGQTDWANLPDLAGVEGVGPISRRVILSDVPPPLGGASGALAGGNFVSGALLVYTRLVLIPEEWDALFEQAFVAALAAGLASVALPDRKAMLTERGAQIALAKQALVAARVANGNESGFPQSTDHMPDWIQGRGGRAGGLAGAGWDMAGPGSAWYGWAAMGWADGSVF